MQGSSPIAEDFTCDDQGKHTSGGDIIARVTVWGFERYEGAVLSRTVELAGYCQVTLVL